MITVKWQEVRANGTISIHSEKCAHIIILETILDRLGKQQGTGKVQNIRIVTDHITMVAE